MSDLIKRVVDGYAGMISPASPCVFGLQSNDGKHVNFIGIRVCHAQLNYQNRALYDQLITSYPGTDLKFFEYLKENLFRKWSEFINIEQYLDTDQYYIRVTYLDKVPAKVVYNFCIASRLPYEMPLSTAKWHKYVDRGIDPGFAFCAIAVQDSAERSGHWAIDNTSDPKLVMSGSPMLDKENGSYKSDGSCTPCNVIWGHSTALRGLTDSNVDDFWNNWKQKNEQEVLLASG